MSEPAPPSLPELHQSVLDLAGLDALEADLTSCAEVLAVIPKAGPGHVAFESIDLSAGMDQLRQGGLRGLQVRYHYQGAEWWDTLIAESGAFRITRIKQDFS